MRANVPHHERLPIIAIGLAMSLVAGCAAESRRSGESTPRVGSTRSSPHSTATASAQGSRDRHSPNAGALRVAITLDDLGVTAESSQPALSEPILRALEAHRAPVAVFANCRALERETLVMWQTAGATLGNHTATHLSLDAAGPDGVWRNDVESCHRELSGLLREPVRFFRFPYLRYGKTAEFRERAAQALASLGYSVAHVTAATSEWLLASYYDEAVKQQDPALIDELAVAYVEHMVKSLQAARELALRKVGRDVIHITLAHVNRLAADSMGSVLAALRAEGWAFVTLEEALADPVYSLPDRYTGACGCSWLARIDPALTREDPYVFGDYEDQIRERFEKRVGTLR